MIKEHKAKVGFYRIIGNSIPGLHSAEQAVTSLEHILKNESNFPGWEKHFVLNRLIDSGVRSRLINLLNLYNASWFEIHFTDEEYKKTGYDLKSLPDSYFWFSNSGPWENIVKNAAIRNNKNAYICNNNGARNISLERGKRSYSWILPWDGNCFLSDSSFQQLNRFFQNSDDFKYAISPMQRLNDGVVVTSTSVPQSAIDEPQVSFRYDASEIYNEQRVYGNQSKTELLKRIGCPGPWDEKVNLYPWRKLEWFRSAEAGMFKWVSPVFRLFSGYSQSVIDGKNRSHARGYGIANLVDSAEAKYVSNNFLTGAFRQPLVSIIEEHGHSYFDTSPEMILEKLGSNFSTSDNIITALALSQLLAYGKLTADVFPHDLTTALAIGPSPELHNEEVYLDCLANSLSMLIISLVSQDFMAAIKNKINIIMLAYFYIDTKEVNVFEASFCNYIKLLLSISCSLFKHIFSYDLKYDLNQVGHELPLFDSVSELVSENISNAASQ